MEPESSLIATLAIGFILALLLGLVAVRLKMPPLVGFLLAGVCISPYTPGFIGQSHFTSELSEVGVILLMFGVGLHFSVADLLAVRRIAIPGAVLQILAATAIGALLVHLWGWGWGTAVIFGLALSVASTVVLLRMLEERDLVQSADGRIAVGWLVVEDLAMVLALVLLPPFAQLAGAPPSSAAPDMDTAALLWSIALTIGKVALFAALALLVGKRVMPWLLQRVAKTGSRELFTLAVMAIALGIAWASARYFDVSFALGAFFAGMILNESDLSHRAATDSLPLQDAFAVLFFVSVGMLFDPTILVRHPFEVLATVLVITVGKASAAYWIVLAFGRPRATALLIAASLAQIGEFSFILAGLGRQFGLLSKEGQDLILAGAILSIALNPLLFHLAKAPPVAQHLAPVEPPPARDLV